MEEKKIRFVLCNDAINQTYEMYLPLFKISDRVD